MKTSNLRTVSPFRKTLLYAIILLGSLGLSSYKTMACTASFSYTAGLNGHYTFTSTSTGFSGAFYYSWNPGDGSGWSPGNSTFSHLYTANGTYYARLFVTDSTCSDTSVVDTIVVSNVTIPCTLSAGINVTYGSGGQVTFTSISAGTNSSTVYYWSPGDSAQRYLEPSVYTHTYLWDGYYSVWLTVEDTGNAYCIDSTEVNILVNNADSTPCNVHANFSYSLDTNGQVTFTNTSTGTLLGDLYTWNLGDLTNNITGSYSPFTHTYASNGTYTVTLLINSDSSLCFDSVSIPVTVTNACSLNVGFIWRYDSSGQVLFTSTSTGAISGAQYGWSFGDTTSLNAGDTATHRYSFIGYYNVTLTVVNPGGCTESLTQTIYIYNVDSLEARFVYAPDSLSTGEYNFTSTSMGTNVNTYYKWTPGDGDASDSGLGMTTYQHTYLSNGPYSATLTIWYTILPHSFIRHAPEYDISSYTLIIDVLTVITGISSLGEDGQAYTVYPNPNDGSFDIIVNGLANETNAEIRISNLMGQEIYETNAAVKGGNTLRNINIPNIATGVYLLQIITPDNTFTSKITINR
jgi:PKD repeat protein